MTGPAKESSAPREQMATSNQATKRPRVRRSLIVRSVLWIAISLVFLIWNLQRIVQMNTRGLPVRWWAYAQILLWLIALGFWLRTGWRDFERRDSRRDEFQVDKRLV